MDVNRTSPAAEQAGGEAGEFRDKKFLFSRRAAAAETCGSATPRSSALTGHECEQPACIQQAAQMVGYMNYSVNPCDDFYEYACGQFSVRHPRGIHISYGVSNMLEDYNRGRLEELLEQPQFHDDDSATSKARTFYTSCINAYDQSDNNARSMVDLINSLGGMELFGTWQEDGWDFLQTFQKTRELHRVRLFFVVIWFQKLNRIIIRLPRLGLSVSSAYKVGDPLHNSTMDNYRRTITNVLELLERDSLVLERKVERNCNSSCVQEIVDDIVDVETQISQLAPGIIDILPSPRNNVNMTGLGQLTDRIDWMELMDALFGKGSITNTVSVHIPSRDYMTGINNLINKTSKRKMQHYMMWALIRQYLTALGPKYSILGQELEHSIDGRETKSREQICYDLLRTYMGRAVRALFISGHIGDQKVESVRSLVADVRDVLNDSFGWMTESARQTSQEVLRNLTVLYGHTPWITNKQKLDDYYKHLSLDTTDFFQNLRAAYESQSIEYKSKGTTMEDESEAENGYWIKSEPSDVKISFSPLLLAMNVPYGALQVPWYHHENPSYINSAALGSILYSVLAQPFLLQHTTTNKYKDYKTCIRDRFSKYETHIPRGFQMSQGRQKVMFMRPVVPLDPRPSMDYLQAQHYALQLAYKLHKKLEAKQTSGPILLPGMKHTTTDQSFFLAYAQSRCQNNQMYLEVLLNAAFHKFPHPKLINNLVFNNPHFKEAYQCNKVPPQHSSRECNLV
ncbi:endothelin-converting enzyme 2-like [Pollicipes pollicipes]|uniref:endothelin-converting enzyme 2-like n=1 Tax=Pollicipes pollicipes TaxID=41117 RepID=UPI001884A4F7|nr:endothelin-converting enzyme 2-like [Pollicipes pollicipes]